VAIKEIDYERNRSEAIKYGVIGTPAILIFKDGKLVKRYLGETNLEELGSLAGDL
jgi:thiol-disulfide isomerase/thioredoxin